jgi:hypothetical protein
MSESVQTYRERGPASATNPGFGQPASRVEARLKVTGAARYASDLHGNANPAHA